MSVEGTSRSLGGHFLTKESTETFRRRTRSRLDFSSRHPETSYLLTASRQCCRAVSPQYPLVPEILVVLCQLNDILGLELLEGSFVSRRTIVARIYLLQQKLPHDTIS